MIYTPSLGKWLEEQLWKVSRRVLAPPSDVEFARALRRQSALRALRDDPSLDRLRAGVAARLVEGERTERIVRWVMVEVLTGRILAGAGR